VVDGISFVQAAEGDALLHELLDKGGF